MGVIFLNFMTFAIIFMAFKHFWVMKSSRKKNSMHFQLQPWFDIFTNDTNRIYARAVIFFLSTFIHNYSLYCRDSKK